MLENNLPHEKAVESKRIYEGKTISVRVDDVVFPDGKKSLREVCERVDAVAILPIDSDGKIYLEKQYRYPFDEEIYEIPAGKMDKVDGETPLECAVRELKEETGFTAGKIEPIGKIYPSPGFVTEILYLFIATELTEGDTDFDDDEYINLVKLSADEVKEMIVSGRITDAKTIAAMYIAQNR